MKKTIVLLAALAVLGCSGKKQGEKLTPAPAQPAKTTAAAPLGDSFVKNLENPLMRQKPREYPASTSPITGKRGTAAYVELPAETFQSLSLDNYAEFYLYFKDKGYNWVEVVGFDGYGVLFPGGDFWGTFGYFEKEGLHWVLKESVDKIIFYDDQKGTCAIMEDD